MKETETGVRMTNQSDGFGHSHADRVQTLCADSGIDVLDFCELDNGVVRVQIAPLLVAFGDANRTLTQRMVEHGWFYGVGFSSVFAQHAEELTFRPLETIR